MAKAVITYDLNDPEDAQEHLRSTLATKMALTIWEMITNGEKSARNEFEFLPDTSDTLDALDVFMDNFRQELEDNGINIETLIT